jgi:hypothetical protein
MQPASRAFALLLALAMLLGACGSADDGTTPIDRAGPGDVTDAGVEGAFGSAEDCEELIDEAADAFARVVTELGDAGRNQVNRIDAALESFGGVGPDLQVRFDGLDCGEDEFQAAVCAAIGGLTAGGPAAEDFLDVAAGGCDAA